MKNIIICLEDHFSCAEVQLVLLLVCLEIGCVLLCYLKVW